MRRFPRALVGCRAAAAAVALAAVFVWLAPVVLAPLFNEFEPLPAGSRLRADVLELGRAAGVDIGEVYRVDASRRVDRRSTPTSTGSVRPSASCSTTT